MNTQNEKCIVNVTYTEAWSFTDSEGKAAVILEEAKKYEKEAAELCERHATNYPDNADYWKRQAERHRAAKFEIMSGEEFTKRQREKLLAGEPLEVTAEDWHYSLNVLPPENWVQVDGVDEFCMSERLTAYYTTQYAHDLRSGKYYCKTVDMYDPKTWIHNYLRKENKNGSD